MILQLNICLRRHSKKVLSTRRRIIRKIDKDFNNYRKGSRVHFRRPRVVSDEISKNLGVSDTTIRRIAEEDLRFKFYVIKVRQMLSEVQNWLSEMFWIWIQLTTMCGPLLNEWSTSRDIPTWHLSRLLSRWHLLICTRTRCRERASALRREAVIEAKEGYIK